MPYRIRKRGDKFVVQKTTGGSQQQVGSHETRASAQRQLTALRISESKENNG